MDQGHYLELNVRIINSRGTEYTALLARILNLIEALENEPDEEKAETDESFRRELSRMTDQTTILCNNLVILKMVSRLLVDLEKDVSALEECKAEEPDKDYSACYKTADKTVDQIRQNLKDSSIAMDQLVYQQSDLLARRLLKLKTETKVDLKPPTIIHAGYKKDFDIPKVNIPKFKGGMENWLPFWTRYKPAVEDNPDLKDPVRMAILIDLVTDPGLNEFLTASNDGAEGRYREAIETLKQRFDKPRELHQEYCRRLAELPPIQNSPDQLNRTAYTVSNTVAGLRRSGQDTIDSIATSLVVSILPKDLRTEWETKTESELGVPKIDQWVAFIRKKATISSQRQKVELQPASIAANKTYKEKRINKSYIKPEPKVYHNSGEPAGGQGQATPSGRSKKARNNSYTPRAGCVLCSELHFLFQCRVFQDMTVQQRKQHVQTASLCVNCLRTGHKASECQSTYRCRICKGTHNTLLHTDGAGATPPATVNHVLHVTDEGPQPQTQQHKMMMTSLVLVTGPTGEQMTVRAMLDSGAETSILSKKIMDNLKLKPVDWVNVSGIESALQTPSRPKVNITVSSLQGDWSKAINPVVLPKVTINLPRHDLASLKELPHLQNLTMADPHFYQTRKVDLILDTDVFDEVLLPKKIAGPPGTPSAWSTSLGWGVMGRYTINQSMSVHTTTVSPSRESGDIRLDKVMEHFWLIEEGPKGASILSPQETAVQQHFLATHYFSPPVGRYVVTLPKRVTNLQLGESYDVARRRFLNNETSLLKKGKWATFQEVVQEYLTLGHAQLVTDSEKCTPVALTYTLPMHAVYKATSSSTKVRVVFDASCPTTSGLSLNDTLAVGPTLHPNLDQILVKFRSYRVAISSDIGKMYREILLSQADRQLHRFVWREHPGQPLALYCMNRVTFGVRSSPYVAVRALQQAAVDFGEPGSVEQWHLCNSFYVDDFLAGADDETSAAALCQSLRDLLSKAGFELKKWRSSSTRLLQSIPSDLQEVLPQQEMVDHHAYSYPKTLGIAWDSRKDEMAAQVQLPEPYTSTKRGIVSDTARSYDLLGWLSTFILSMKVLFQQLWKQKLGWDTPLEGELANKHQEWRSQLHILKSVTVPRCYFSPGTTVTTQLHGFSDASEKAYAAVIYIRATYQDNSVSSRLVIAKTKVAPLCGASLVLMTNVTALC